jgi:hypothetical protein
VRIDSGDRANTPGACAPSSTPAVPRRHDSPAASDEYRLRELFAQAAPIDGFGVGTRMDTSADAPYLDCAYKLEEYEGRPRRKRSEGKATWPGRKQVYRCYDTAGVCTGDTLALVDDASPGVPLLAPVMRDGRLVGATPDLAAARERARCELARLPEPQRGLGDAPPYPVAVTPALRALAATVMRRHERATDRLGCECRSARHESTAVNAAAVPLPSSSVAIPADGVLLPGDLTLPGRPPSAYPAAPGAGGRSLSCSKAFTSASSTWEKST